MREYKCQSCGYQKVEKELFDYIAQGPMYPNFAANSMIPFISAMSYEQMDDCCPNCGRRDSWNEMKIDN